MKNHADIITWATNYLMDSIDSEVVVETPWSNVIRLTCSKGVFYLKQPAPTIAREAKILQLLKTNVPSVLATNEDLHCFLLQDAGLNLRSYLKTNPQLDLLYQATQKFITMQRSVENHAEAFFALGVLDWRLEKLPTLFDTLINQNAFLKSEGMSDKEIQLLHKISPQIKQEFALLANYQIPETIVQPDFNTNNVLFDPISKKLTCIDLGEIVISHPFFALHNFLYQITLHEGIKENDLTYLQIQNICINNWQDCGTKIQIEKAFQLSKKLWPIYSAIVLYHFMHFIVDIDAYKSFYALKPNRVAGFLREYIG